MARANGSAPDERYEQRGCEGSSRARPPRLRGHALTDGAETHRVRAADLRVHGLEPRFAPHAATRRRELDRVVGEEHPPRPWSRPLAEVGRFEELPGRL